MVYDLWRKGIANVAVRVHSEFGQHV